MTKVERQRTKDGGTILIENLAHDVGALDAVAAK